MNAILTVSSIIFPLITFPYVSRVLGAAQYGRINFATSVISYFQMIAELGIPTYGIRSCAKVRNDKDKLSKTVQEILFINTITMVISYLLFLTALISVYKFRVNNDLLLVTSIGIFFNTIGMDWFYQSLEQYAYITIRSIAFKFISIVAMFIFVHRPSDYLIYAAITVFANVGSNLFNFFHAKNYLNICRYKNYNIRKHLKPIFVFFTMSVAANIYVSLNTIVLGFIASNADVGYYNAALRIRVILIGVVNSLATVLLPRASQYISQKNYTLFYQLSRKATNSILVIATPLWIYFSLYAKESIVFLSGNEYISSVKPMIIIMPTVLICGLSNLLAMQVLIPLGKEKFMLLFQVFAAISCVILDMIIIKTYKTNGAAFTTMFSELVVLLGQMIFLYFNKIHVFNKENLVKIAFAILVSSGASLLVKVLHMHVFITLVFSSVIFFGIYVIILLLLKDQVTIEIVNTCLNILHLRRGKNNDQ